MISIGCLSRCGNEECLAEVSTVVVCGTCGNSYCLECGETLIKSCDVCHKGICRSCVATIEDASYTVCSECLEKLLVTSENYSNLKAGVSQAIAISKCDNTTGTPDNFQRRLYLCRQIGRVRGALIGLSYRFGFSVILIMALLVTGCCTTPEPESAQLEKAVNIALIKSMIYPSWTWIEVEKEIRYQIYLQNERTNHGNRIITSTKSRS